MPSSPYNPKSNGIAENSVKELKKLVHCLFKPGRKIDQEEWCRALLIHVNTPKRPSGLTPSQLMFGRDLRDGVSLLKDLLTPEHQAAIERRAQAIKDHQLSLAKADRLPPLAVGQRVAVQDPVSKKWSKFGTIQEMKRKRSYLIKIDNGPVYWRNRKFLKPLPSHSTSLSNNGSSPPTSSASSQPKPATESSTPAPPRRSSRVRRQPVRFS